MRTTATLASAVFCLAIHIQADAQTAAPSAEGPPSAPQSTAAPERAETEDRQPAVGTASQPSSPSLTDSLLDAAKANDTATVKRLVTQGANVNSVKGDSSALIHAVMNSNPDLVRWLVDHGANISNLAIFHANRDNHLTEYTTHQREIAAYLIYSRLAKKGYPSPKLGSDAQVLFVRKIKEAIVARLKQDKLWPEKVARNWVIRVLDVQYPVKLLSNEGENSFLLFCDIAVWNESLMLEIATKTGLTFALPNALAGNAASHAWLFSNENGTSVLSTSFEQGKVLWGDFLITKTKDGQFTAKRTVFK